MIRIVIAEDHHLVRQGLRALLETQSDLQVVGEAEDGQQALELIEKLVPDLAILDINMPRLGGLEVTKIIHERDLPTQVLILTMFSDESVLEQALRNGARGYLLKRSVAEELHNAVRQTAVGELFLSNYLLEEHDLDSLYAADRPDAVNPIDTLTAREVEILQLIATGRTNHAIASDLAISSKTVEKHRSNLMRKMGAQNMAGLITRGIKLGLIHLEPVGK